MLGIHVLGQNEIFSAWMHRYAAFGGGQGLMRLGSKLWIFQNEWPVSATVHAFVR